MQHMTSPGESLTAAYRINDENLALRKQLLGLTAADIATLRMLAPWARRVSATLFREFYDHQFSHPGTRTFFEAQAERKGLSLPQLRAHLEKMQAAFFERIFAEAADGGRFGASFFEERLRIGKLHNQINLPLKWYLASYGMYLELVRKHLRRSFLLRPDIVMRGERAISLILNYDMQAVCDAFFYDYLQSIGLDLSAVKIARLDEDLSEHYAALKSTVRDALTGAGHASAVVVRVSGDLREATANTAQAVQQVTDAMQHISAGAVSSSQAAQESSEAMRQLQVTVDTIAKEAGDQALRVETVAAITKQMAESVERVATDGQELAQVGETTRDLAERGASAVRETIAGISVLTEVVGVAAHRVEALGQLSERIGAVVETIDDIAEQTNLLALNAAIEAARAGDHGRGFAVVADEVRKLAERSQRETRAIADLIREVQSGTREAVASMKAGSERVADGAVQAERAGAALTEILAAVGMTVTRVNGIASEANDMATGARDVVDAMSDMTMGVQQNRAATEEMAAQAASVTSAIESIAAFAEQSSASTEQVSASAEEVMAQIEETNSQAGVLASTADELHLAMIKFRLESSETEEAVVPRRRSEDWQRPAQPRQGHNRRTG